MRKSVRSRQAVRPRWRQYGDELAGWTPADAADRGFQIALTYLQDQVDSIVDEALMELSAEMRVSFGTPRMQNVKALIRTRLLGELAGLR